ncbi:hypothetical protein ACFVUS_30145 [Nocardia sp. NPDC058058]|uniref:hypothetical protein n=1 Tax=Nocardia sp. NPDC058058 TaxID=3346317 RepID=UPI0036DBDE0C
MATCGSSSKTVAALSASGVLAGPIAGGQLVLLSKPLGGVLGIPGAVVGYIALTVLTVGGVTALFAVRRQVPSPVAGACALVAGAGFAVAGWVSAPWQFVVAVLVAGAAAGPLVVTGRALAFDSPGALTRWQIAMVAGVTVTAGMASLCYERPGLGLAGAGAALTVLGLGIVLAKHGVTPPGSLIVARGSISRRYLLGYAVAGWIVGGTVLPALHVLLFRWNALGAEQTNLLLLASVPAIAALMLPGPRIGAVVPLLILAAGGPVLVATAPGRVTLTIGLGVALAAAARAARGLDLAVRAEAARSHRMAALTALTVVIAGAGGLATVTALGEILGTGSGLTVLAIPALALAPLCVPRAPVRVSRSPLIAQVLEGEAP